MVLDLGLPDMSGLELLETIKRELNPHAPPRRRLHRPGPDPRGAGPARRAGRDDDRQGRPLAGAPGRQDRAVPPPGRGQPAPDGPAGAGTRVHAADPELAGKKVLIVDDDVRNIFALTSKLERWEMVVAAGRERQAGARAPAEDPGIDLVLMDIMMPEMDGYETIAGDPGASTGSVTCRSSP